MSKSVADDEIACKAYTDNLNCYLLRTMFLHVSFHYVVGGNRPYKALWMFNILRGCRTTIAITDAKAIHFPNMLESDIDYLSSIPDEQQYLATRCTMADGIIMYLHSSTASVESMNRAHMCIREWSAVDLVNACILLIKMEAECFEKKKAKVWAHDHPLTPRGIVIVEEIYKDIKHQE